VHCARAANDALEAGEFGANFLRRYQDAWMDDIGKELKHAQVLHRMMAAMSDKQLDLALEILGDPALKELIVKARRPRLPLEARARGAAQEPEAAAARGAGDQGDLVRRLTGQAASGRRALPTARQTRTLPDQRSSCRLTFG